MTCTVSACQRQEDARESSSIAAVGIVENAVPGYCAEIAPDPLRGFFAGSLVMLSSSGNLWGAGMSRAFVNSTTKVGWLVSHSRAGLTCNH